ncbi:MAG: alpha/beta fold hydrolase [Clostridia bacterium]|nr:alpha/beta fold hydrolase [Clostridia bacterium]
MSRRPEKDWKDEICQPFLLKGQARNGKNHGVLLIHGFTGSAAHMRLLGDKLHAQGFTVMGVNLPGHATDMDDMARCTWDDWLIAAKDAFLQLKERCDYVSVAGLSMGGCLALILAQQLHPTAVAPISAPMGTLAPLWAATLASPFMKTVWWHARDEKVIPATNEYDRGYPGFRTSCARHLARLIRMARRDLHAVTCHILVVQSHADETITPDSADIILQGVSSRIKGALWLEDAPHVCTISKEADNIANALAELFRRAEDAEMVSKEPHP